MKICKTCLFIVGITVLLLSSMTATAEEIVNDDMGDVYHWFWDVDTQTFGWQMATDDKPNIDIKDISFSIDKNIATFTITVSPEGEIETSAIAYYWGTYVSGENIVYWFSYSNGEALGMASNADTTQIDMAPDYSIDTNTLTIMFDSVGEGASEVEFHGYAYTWTETGGQTGESWWDYAPDSYFTGEIEDTETDEEDPDTGETDDTEEETDDTTSEDGDGGTSNNTPGFEAFVVIAAIGIIYFTLRRKK